jgi:hypothetical protein
MMFTTSQDMTNPTRVTHACQLKAGMTQLKALMLMALCTRADLLQTGLSSACRPRLPSIWPWHTRCLGGTISRRWIVSNASHRILPCPTLLEEQEHPQGLLPWVYQPVIALSTTSTDHSPITTMTADPACTFMRKMFYAPNVAGLSPIMQCKFMCRRETYCVCWTSWGFHRPCHATSTTT